MTGRDRARVVDACHTGRFAVLHDALVMCGWEEALEQLAEAQQYNDRRGEEYFGSLVTTLTAVLEARGWKQHFNEETGDIGWFRF